LAVVAPVALVVAALVSVTLARWCAAGWKRAEDQLRETRDALRVVVDDRDIDFFEAEEAVENVFWEYGYQTKPLTPTALDVLRNGKSCFARYVERGCGGPQAVILRPEAYQNLGQINYSLGRIGESEVAYRESLRLARRLREESSDPVVRRMLAAGAKCLGCLLATTGRAAEAERLTSEAVAELEGLLAEDPDDCLARAELAHARRNLGLILAALGRDGTKDVRRCIAQTILLASQAPDHIRIAEYLVDSHQILAQLLRRQGRFSEAEDACRRSIQAIDDLLTEFQAAADRDGHRLRTLKYRRASVMARANLTRFPPKHGARPSADGYSWSPLVRLPGRLVQADVLLRGSLSGEFESQEAILMAWVDEAWCRETLVKIVVETYRHVQVILLVENELIEEDAKAVLRAAGVTPDRVRFRRVPTDTLWVRDYGPLVIDTGDGTYQCVAPRRPIDVEDPRLQDAYASWALSRLLEMPVVPTPVLLEGGEILSNGQGLCLVSTSLLQKNSQFGYPQSHVTNAIGRLFGATEIVYLEPLHDEPTGHVDWYATFTSPDTLVLGDYRGTDPVNASLLDRHAERLAGVATAGGPLRIVRIPMPPRGDPHFGGTYTNVLFANGVLLVPSYPDAPPELEREAFDVYRRLLPGWSVVGVECPGLIAREGALHCAAVNLYRARRPSWSGVAAGAPWTPAVDAGRARCGG